MDRPNTVRDTTRPGVPYDRNAVFTIRSVFALKLAAKTGRIKVTAPKVALKFILVLVGIGIHRACRNSNDFARIWIDRSIIRSNLKASLYKTSTNWRTGLQILLAISRVREENE